MPDGGVLKIDTQNVVLNEQAAVGALRGPYVRLCVTDTGLGMTPEVQERVFEPFFTTKEAGKGTGLGLSMVYGFVRQSGGHVTVESSLGVGTSVALYLPRAPQSTEMESEVVQSKVVPLGSERILLVEDNEDLLEATEAMLIASGYQVASARSGEDAIAILKSGAEFELLFSDVVMPNGMNGIELAREARLLNNEIRVLLTSGYADDVMERHHATDEFPIIHKPYRLPDLAQRLRLILHKS